MRKKIYWITLPTKKLSKLWNQIHQDNKNCSSIPNSSSAVEKLQVRHFQVHRRWSKKCTSTTFYFWLEKWYWRWSIYVACRVHRYKCRKSSVIFQQNIIWDCQFLSYVSGIKQRGCTTEAVKNTLQTYGLDTKKFCGIGWSWQCKCYERSTNK